MNSFESQPKKLELCPRESGMFLSGMDQAGNWHGPWMGSRCRPPSGESQNAVRSLWLSLEQNSVVLNCLLLGLNISILKETLYFVTRMPVNENRTTKAKHIYYQMPPVDHCYRENISRGYARGEVRKSFFFFHFVKKQQSKKSICI